MKKKLTPRACRILSAVLAAALLIAVNGCASLASGQFGLRLDMTGARLYQLSEQSGEVLNGLTEPVEIHVLSAEAEYLPLMNEVLQEYRRLGGGKLMVDYIDPYALPARVDEYLQRGLAVEVGSLVVEGPQNAKAIQLEELFEMDSSGSAVRGLRCEQQITSAVLAVSSGQELQVGITTGHNESVSQGFLELLAQNNCTVQNLNLAMTGIGEETDLVIIAAPTADFTEDEIAALDRFLEGGGRLLVFAAPAAHTLERLEAFWEEWGIRLTGRAVAEPLQYTEGNPLWIVPIYASHEINQYFANNQIYPVLPSTRALEQTFVSQGGIRTQKLLYSTDRAYDQQDPDGEKGPFVLAMTAEKELADGTARMAVFGGSGICTDALLQSDTYANAKLLARTIGWCTETESGLHIPTKRLDDFPISLTVGGVILLAALFVVILPAAVLICGFVTFRRRRRS